MKPFFAFLAVAIAAVGCASKNDEPVVASDAALTDPATAVLACTVTSAFTSGHTTPLEFISFADVGFIGSFIPTVIARFTVPGAPGSGTFLYFGNWEGEAEFYTSDATLIASWHRAVPQLIFDATGDRLPCDLILADDSPDPVIGSVAPSQVKVHGTDETIVVSGTGFTTTSVVLLNGRPLSTTYRSPTELAAALTASFHGEAGDLPISVKAGSWKLSAPAVLSFVYDMPVLQSVATSPAEVHVGPFVNVVVHGASFTEHSRVVINNVPQGTAFVSSTTLRSSFVPSRPGVYTIRVQTPPPGGGTSVDALSVTVEP